MAFQSLYRKYRPQRFDALVGQDPVTTALRNAVREQRVGHAYLLSGPRGTGKTTSARILAKALNCLDLGADGEPCDACMNCTGISAGTFTDLIELDAASNRGVQEARDLVSRINLGLGAGSSRKVYILDEVHMLTTEASNTLLKTLEEPPDHVVFVLATTDPQKVLPTIRSRTQHFEFSLLSVQDLSAHLAHILDLEAVEYEDEALEIVARAAAGSARDALSLLDQALAHSDGRVTAEQVRSAFGGSPFAQRLAVLDAVASEDTAGVLVCNAALLASGHDPRRIAEDLLRTLRDTFLLIAGGGRVEVDPSLEEQAQLKVVGAALGTAQMVRALETLGQAIIDMRGSEAADPRLVLEVALVRLARRDTGTPLQALSDRVERLERAVGDGRAISTAVTSDEGSEKAAAPRAAAPSGPKTPQPAQAPPIHQSPEPAISPSPRPSAPSSPSPTGSPEPEENSTFSPSSPRPGLGALRASVRAITDAPSQGSATASADRSGGSQSGGSQSGASAASESTPTPPATPQAAGAAFESSIEEVIEAWAGVLETLERKVQIQVQAANPVSVTDGVVTFAVPRDSIDSVRPKFQQEAPAIRDGFLAALGEIPRFLLVPIEPVVEVAEPVEERPKRKPPKTVAEPVEPERELEDGVHPDDIIDTPINSEVDSVTRIESLFGGTVVEEHEKP